MIKKQLLQLFSALILFIPFAGIAQVCTPDPVVIASGYHGVFPTFNQGVVSGVVGLNYSQTFTIFAPSDTVVSGYTAEIDSVLIDSIANMPAGLSLTYSNSDSMYFPNVAGCFIISGTIADTAGLYVIRLYVTPFGMVYATPVGDLMLQDLGAQLWSTYNLQVNACANLLPVITNTNNELDCGLSGYTYQWYLDSVAVTGANGQTYQATADGNYYVVVTDVNSCTFSSPALNVVTGIEENTALHFSIYPNPCNTYFTLQLNTAFAINSTVLNVTDISGRLVHTTGINNRKYELDITALAKGIYFITLQNNEGVSTRRIEIIK